MHRYTHVENKKPIMISPNQLAEIVIKTITTNKTRRLRIVNVNSKHLSVKGDLSFRLGINYWRGYVNTDTNWFKNSKNILQYFMYKCLNSQDCASNDNQNDYEVQEFFKRHIVEELEKIYNINNINLLWIFNISDSFALINFNRPIVSYIAIKTVIEQGDLYGKKQNSKRYFKLKVEVDHESEITSLRLNLLKKISLNLLKFRGCDLCDKDSSKDNNYIFTIKSEGKAYEDYNRYLCGVVLNTNKRKESFLNQEIYLQRKIEQIKKLNSVKYLASYVNTDSIEADVKKTAKAAIRYELLSVKHSSPVIIENSNDTDNCIKEAAFILYNNARITAILEKYKELVQIQELPVIVPLEKIKTFSKITDEESWSLIYNYIIKYPDVLEDVVQFKSKLDVNIQLLWSFVSNLCHDFSKYYRKNKILIQGINTNDQMFNITTERLHMLRALQIILHNSLSLLDIEELKYM